MHVRNPDLALLRNFFQHVLGDPESFPHPEKTNSRSNIELKKELSLIHSSVKKHLLHFISAQWTAL